MHSPSKAYFFQALDALRGGDRRAAAALIGKELKFGNTSLKNLPSVGQLATQIGEMDLAIDAARRSIVPGSIETLLAYWAALAAHGRGNEALAEADRQPEAVKQHPYVLHFRGAIANQNGQFDQAESLFRQTLAKFPASPDTWFALAMVKTFARDDPDIVAMERLVASPDVPPDARASIFYALGKVMEDCGEVDRAFGFYEKGSAIRRLGARVDTAGFRTTAERVINEFTPESMRRLTPSRYRGRRSLFVTGLPRSGTTLTEQILVSHSAVKDGAEINLVGSALMPSRGGTFTGALAYQQGSRSADPWGDVARDYADLVDRQFRSRKLIVDKSLGQSMIIGLMLHAMPDARIAWLQRKPDDVALSCFTTYFTTGLAWTWSLTDIAETMRVEDRLFDHWLGVFGDRILTVPYEELVAAPAEWAVRLQRHFGLEVEQGLESVSRQDRAVRTASVGQIRGDIKTNRIGRSAAFEPHLKPFRDIYYA